MKSRDDKGNIIHKNDILIDVNAKPYKYYFYADKNHVHVFNWNMRGKKEVYTLDELKDSGYIKIALNKHVRKNQNLSN